MIDNLEQTSAMHKDRHEKPTTHSRTLYVNFKLRKSQGRMAEHSAIRAREQRWQDEEKSLCLR